VTAAERDRASTTKSEPIEQIKKKRPAKNWGKRLWHIIHHPAQPRAEPANEDGYIDAGERERFGDGHGLANFTSRGKAAEIAIPGRGENSASIHQFLWFRPGRFFDVAGPKDMEGFAFISTSGI
jgi:hypothetical protein